MQEGASIEEPISFFGSPVLFHCTECERVTIAARSGAFQNGWEGKATVLHLRGLDSGEVWWFRTRCENCQLIGAKPVPV